MAKKTTRPTTDVRQTDARIDIDQADDRARSVPIVAAPEEDEIRARAYQKFIDRGGAHGKDVDDWVDAERELSAR